MKRDASSFQGPHPQVHSRPRPKSAHSISIAWFPWAKAETQVRERDQPLAPPAPRGRSVVLRATRLVPPARARSGTADPFDPHPDGNFSCAARADRKKKPPSRVVTAATLRAAQPAHPCSIGCASLLDGKVRSVTHRGAWGKAFQGARRGERFLASVVEPSVVDRAGDTTTLPPRIAPGTHVVHGVAGHVGLSQR